MAITVLHLEILLHAYTQSFQPYYLNSTGKKDYAQYLQAKGLIEIKTHPPKLRTAYLSTTEKGAFYIMALLATPFPEPVTSWIIPEKASKQEKL